jgi:P-type conjugative transfer protein TrbG
MRYAFLALMTLVSTGVAGCTTFKPPEIAYDDAQPAVLEREPPKPVQVVELPKPLPLPGQLKPLPGARPRPEPRDPRQRVDLANAAARIQPVRAGYLNAMQVYPFVDGALYQVYAAPGQVTDIALQDGEQLVGSGPVAAGDTVRWIIGDTESGTAAAKKVHILVKPTRPEVITNLVINTDRRTYHMELRSTERTYMASVSWIYPQDQLIALRRQNALADAAAPVETNLDINNLRFRYAIEGDTPPWRPLHAFDDGKKVYIEFPRGIAQGEMPPLFVVGAEGKTSDLVNYRVHGNHMIVDRLFAAAELRLGERGSERRVRIVRTDGRPGW